MFKTINILRVLMTRKDKFILTGITALTVVSAIWEVIGLSLIVPVAAAVIDPQILSEKPLFGYIAGLFSSFDKNMLVIFAALLTVANFALKNLFNLWLLRTQSKFTYRQQEWLSMRLFNNFIHADYGWIAQSSTPEISARINRAAVVCENTLMPLMLIGSDLVVTAAIALTLLLIMPLYLASAIAVLLCCGFLYFPLRKLNNRMGEDFMRADNAVTRDKIETFSGIKTIKTTNSENCFSKRFASSIHDYSTVTGNIFWLGQIPRLGLEFMAVALAMGIFAAMVLLNVRSEIIILNFALLIAGTGKILPALSRMHYNFTRIRQVSEIMNCIFDDINNTPQETPESNAQVPPRCHLHNALEIKNLSFSYPSGKKIFDNFNCRIPAYTSMALIGPTGGGKTTLADIITGLYKPDSGSVTLDGVDLHKNLHGCRDITGYVPQYVFLFNGTIRENVAFGIAPEDIDDVEIDRVLRLANLKEWVDSLPEKSSTVITDNGTNLSGGQRQRLGLARALYRKPELLILDEFTSALDQDCENIILQALQTLRGKVTMLVIAHRLSTIENCDQKITIGQ